MAFFTVDAWDEIVDLLVIDFCRGGVAVDTIHIVTPADISEEFESICRNTLSVPG